MKKNNLKKMAMVMTLSSAAIFASVAEACTGITLRAEDGSVVYGRTLEWATFDLHSSLVVIPRGHQFTGETPDGRNGKVWSGRYGVVGINILNRDVLADAMNEKGLVVGFFYHPGSAQYADYEPAQGSKSMSSTDFINYVISSFATVAEVRAGIKDINIVNVIDKDLGIPAPVHMIVSDPSGEQIVLEWKDGELQVFEAPLGVITNAPNYDWHMTNLRNYVNLFETPHPPKTINSYEITPMGGGTGMLGLPGDFTSPSRFVRAAAFSATARPTKDGQETTYEVFRILDNFNVPLGAAEGEGDAAHTNSLRSSTQWTTAHDLKKRVLYYHTQDNRQVQKFDVGSLDFSKIKEMQTLPLDEKREQTFIDRTLSM